MSAFMTTFIATINIVSADSNITTVPTTEPTLEPTTESTQSTISLDTFNSTNDTCLTTLGFSWGLDSEDWSVYTEGSTVNHTAYTADYNTSTKMYIGWDHDDNRWNIGVGMRWPGWMWAYCDQSDLGDCTAGKWSLWSSKIDSNATVTMVDCDCSYSNTTVETLYFEEESLNGIHDLWHDSLWDIWVIGYYHAYCAAGVDIADCGGRWILYNDDIGYYPDSKGTSMQIDCADSECDGTNLTDGDMQCMLSL